MDSTKEEIVTTKEDKDLLNQSTDLVDDLIKDTTKLTGLEEAASKKSVEELDDELLNDLKC
jgi:hypothetical protein